MVMFASESKLTVRRGSESALCRTVSDTSSECSTDATVVSALHKFQKVAVKNIEPAILQANHAAKHPVCIARSLRLLCLFRLLSLQKEDS